MLTHLNMYEKDGQTHQQNQDIRGFKIFQSALQHLNLAFGTRHNTLYCLRDAAHMLLVMASSNGYANGARDLGSPGIRMPSGSWLLKKLRIIKQDKMNRFCDQMMHDTVNTACRSMRRRISNETAVAAIDKHKIPHHDKNPDLKHLIQSKYESGTYRFESYMTSKIVQGGKEANLCFSPVTRGTSNGEFVRKTIKKCSKLHLGINLYLLDREFYATDVMRTVRSLHRHFIMPAKKNAGIKRAIVQHAQGKRGDVSRYTIKSGSEKFTFNLVLIRDDARKKDGTMFDRYHAFATSLPYENERDVVKYIPEQYKKRWGIETGYRSAKSVRARTASRNPSVRMLLFVLSLVINNIWIGLRRTVCRQRYHVTLAGVLNRMIRVFAEYVYARWPPPIG